MSDVPNLIHVRELRKVHQHLGCGRVLFVAAEAGRGKSILVRLGGLRFRMASGPLRLAQRTGAWVAPCLIRCEAGGRFKIQLGAPIPSELLADSSHHPRAARRLVRWFLPRLKSAPAQYDARHIRAWKARAAREGTEVAKVGAAC